MVIALSLVVLILGSFLYAWPANAKIQEIGRMMFFCGLLAFLLNSATLTAIISR